MNTDEVGYAEFFNEFKPLAEVFKEIILNDVCKKYSEYEKDYFVNCLIGAKVCENVDKNPFN
jgi:hypothetical protein